MNLRTKALRIAASTLLAVSLAGGALAAFPAPAAALTVERTTARPNASDETNDVMGGTETRITWEALVTADEGVEQLTFTLPDGTSYRSADTTVTLLTGDDYMTRVNTDFDVSSDGQSITVDLDTPIDQAGKLNVQIFGVVFPASGGAMQLSGSYEDADGSHEMTDIPAIEVTGISVFEQASQYLAEQPWVQAWNSNKFLKLFFDPTILVTSFPVVVQGFFMSVILVAVAFPLAIPFGLVFAIMRRSKFRVVRALASIYVNIVRGTPMFLQIYIAFFGLPLAGVQIPSAVLGVIVMVMNSSAYMCEIFRAGIASINRGQTEAARSLGMTAPQTMFNVILPQMFRMVIPNLTNEFITLYKDSSLLAAVGTMELVMYAKTIVAATGSITPYIVAAVFYLVITLPLSRFTRYLEDRVSAGRTHKRAAKQGAPAAAASSAE